MWGYAYSLEDPASFDCKAQGGTWYGFNGPSSTTSAVQPSTEPSTQSSDFDRCMQRALRTQDNQLRLKAMEACEGIR